MMEMMKWKRSCLINIIYLFNHFSVQIKTHSTTTASARYDIHVVTCILSAIVRHELFIQCDTNVT